MNKIKEEIKQMNAQELVAKIASLRGELFSLRLNAATAHVKDYSLFKKTRKNLARALTYLHKQ